jgi:hypothetical protein
VGSSRFQTSRLLVFLPALSYEMSVYALGIGYAFKSGNLEHRDRDRPWSQNVIAI